MAFWYSSERQRSWAMRLLALLLASLLITVMLRWFEHNQVYHPDRILTHTGSEL